MKPAPDFDPAVAAKKLMREGRSGALATLLPGSQIRLHGVGINPTRTGLLNVLERMGARVAVFNRRSDGGEPVADLEVAHADLGATTVGAAGVPIASPISASRRVRPGPAETGSWTSAGARETRSTCGRSRPATGRRSAPPSARPTASSSRTRTQTGISQIPIRCSSSSISAATGATRKRLPTTRRRSRSASGQVLQGH